MSSDRNRAPTTARPTQFALFVLVALTALATGCLARGAQPPIIEVVTPSGESSPDEVMRVATANMWGVSILGFDWAPSIDARFDALAERLARNEAGLDVVLIQEAWKDSARRALLVHPGVAEQFPHRVDFVARPGGSGLVILSSLPLEAARFYRFRAQGNCLRFWEGDCLAGKGVAFAQVRFGSDAVWVGNTHLIACYAPDDAAPRLCDEEDPNGLDRWHQLAELKQVVADLAGDDPILLAGDFNFTRQSRYYASMKASANAVVPPASSQAIPRLPTGASEPSIESGDSPLAWVQAGDRARAGRGVDFIWTRAGKTLRWHALEPARAIFEEPVDLSNGDSVPLSDHPILAGGFCLERTGELSLACDPGDTAQRDPTR